MEKKKLAVVGNGMAGIRTVEELLKLAPDLYDITVFGDEPRVNYNRIMLSPMLSGEKDFADIILNDAEWYEANGITLRSGVRVSAIDREARQVITETAELVPYDRLLLATGSRPIILPVPGTQLPQVVSFRDVDDVARMIEAAKSGARAIVIGGGLLGLEAANGLNARGMSVTVVHLMDSLMERQLDAAAGALLRQALEDRGMRFRMKAVTDCILGKDKVEGIRFTDGSEEAADLVVMAVGIRPNTELAANSGLKCDRGVIVDDALVTSDPAIVSVGECVQHRGNCYGLVAPLFDMAKVCAAGLAGMDVAGYEGTVTATRLKVTGIELFSAGDFIGGETTDDILFRDIQAGIYKKLVVRGDKLVGAVLYGETGDGPWYFEQIRAGADISSIRPRLIFGQAHAEGGSGGHGKGDIDVSAMSDDMQICGCNGVSKGTIISAIKAKGLTTLDEVKAYTKASASCGQCSDMVRKILTATRGTELVADEAPAVCKCTDHGHDAVRHAITERGLKTIPEVMGALGWKSADGCAKCRPALNYYLLCAWPGEYEDHQPSRFVNERVHANIQKDGTYSVVPRMWGGLTNAGELRAIADVVDKFDIPTVKVTGGQRVDLLGVKKEDLPAVWADLNAAGMVSGHAYAKGLRTVKTCVGKEWCRFGTQDSTGLGVKLEQMTWGSWTPHKFKMAVSGCPRNCAEASIKDFGVVCVEAGYNLMVGGNGGITLRGADALCQVATEEEVLEYAGAFMQIYREEAWYLERTAPWIERVGIDYVRGRLRDDPLGRKAAYARFLASQKTAQVDPWAERAALGVDAHEFNILRKVG
ncbi:nitrite reductase large subunit NirB [Telmatospirillum sp.]|uniref:nitrite reductase large subunit NirB n=1 Tax=Telmatospirillum sp. TaxID=2079197 RepID=UPI0028505966|nr:nitrite reductase large subunit NirB [Telmatospirillum sp.]MDR3438212.1 nitrite reductase large subunit NirB [Telmatospirillum sp.]